MSQLSDNHNHELLALARAQCDGAISQDESARLEEILADDAEAQTRYLDYVDIHSELRWRFRQGSHATFDLISHASPHEDRQRVEVVRSKPLLRRVLRNDFGIGVAVALLIFAGLFVVLALTPVGGFLAKDGKTESPIVAEPVEIATLTNWHRPEWVKEHAISPRNHRITAGQKIAFTSGLIEITYDTGAKVVIEGPAEFTVGDMGEGDGGRGLGRHSSDDSIAFTRFAPHNSGYLKRGQLVARIDGDDALGFAILTPSAVVQDHGTKFGVMVDAHGDAEVVVIEGKVVAQPVALGSNPMVLIANQAVSIAKNSKIMRRVKAQHRYPTRIRNDFADSGPLRASSEYVAAVTAARPVAYWRLSQATDTFVPNQMSDRNHARRMSRGQWPADPTYLDGAGTYLEVENEIGDTFSLEAWIRMKQPSHRGEKSFLGSTLFTCEISGYKNDFTVSVFNDRMAYWEGPEETDTRGKRELANGQWHHVVLTRERGAENGLRIYVDGKLDARAATNDKILNENPQFLIGGMPSGRRYFKGWIDEVAVYDRALSEKEIATHYELMTKPKIDYFSDEDRSDFSERN